MRKTAIVSSLLLIFGILNVYSSYAQEEEYSFNHFKSLGDKNVVYFGISGLVSDNEEAKRVLELLLEDELVYDGNIYFTENGKNNCQLDIAIAVSVSYIRSIIQTAGYDIDLSTVASRSPQKPTGIYNADFYTFDKSFDAYKNYNPNDNNTSSEQHYANEKEKWIKEHPEEYETAKNKTTTAVIVKRKDLELFTEQKKQHILSHPEIFIIVD